MTKQKPERGAVKGARGSGRRAIIAGAFSPEWPLRRERRRLYDVAEQGSRLVQIPRPLEGTRLTASQSHPLQGPGIELLRVLPRAAGPEGPLGAFHRPQELPDDLLGRRRHRAP